MAKKYYDWSDPDKAAQEYFEDHAAHAHAMAKWDPCDEPNCRHVSCRLGVMSRLALREREIVIGDA